MTSRSDIMIKLASEKYKNRQIPSAERQSNDSGPGEVNVVADSNNLEYSASSCLVVTVDKENDTHSVRSRSNSIESSSESSTSSSFNEDSDDSVRDPDYQDSKPADRRRHISSSDSDGNDENVPTSIQSDQVMQKKTDKFVTPTKIGKKRRRQEANWKKNVAKRLRNSGKSYLSAGKKIIEERQLKPPCKENCSFKCRLNITEEQRQQILRDYWDLGQIEKQWAFIANSIETVIPKHRYVKVDSDGTIGKTRNNNNTFFFVISGVKTRICKIFFKNTLRINNRPIETALIKRNKDNNISSMKDNRGCHKNHKKVDDNIKNGVSKFIESIPKIESHYTRANSKRVYIDGSKAITDLHRDYVEMCKSKNIKFATYVMFYRIFTQEFNISFFVPKKDMCDVCEVYKNSTEEEKETKKESYEIHISEKQMSRQEKENDKKNENILVAVYDLQAVFQCPKGDVSVFYYKSKLNVFNLSIYNIQSNVVECYVWDESNAHRGVNEIATCVFKYLTKVSERAKDLEVVFFSDNCAGQQKNKFMIAMYLYATQTLTNLKSITHKYLIRGHTQNEGDSAHSQIEREVKRQLRSGPMYTPDAFIGAIKAARKKSEPMHVNEMSFEDFHDWKSLCNQINFSIVKDLEGKSVKTSEIKIIRVQKDEPDAMFFKYSYADPQFKKASVIKRKKDYDINVELKNAYNVKPGLAEKKKKDLMELVNKRLIPRYHKPFYESL